MMNESKRRLKNEEVLSLYNDAINEALIANVNHIPVDYAHRQQKFAISSYDDFAIFLTHKAPSTGFRVLTAALPKEKILLISTDSEVDFDNAEYIKIYVSQENIKSLSKEISTGQKSSKDVAPIALQHLAKQLKNLKECKAY